VIDQGRKNLKADSDDEAFDLLTGLLKSKTYGRNDEMLKDEIFTVFLAGMHSL
jgi:cytochrome P450